MSATCQTTIAAISTGLPSASLTLSGWSRSCAPARDTGAGCVSGTTHGQPVPPDGADVPAEELHHPFGRDARPEPPRTAAPDSARNPRQRVHASAPPGSAADAGSLGAVRRIAEGSLVVLVGPPAQRQEHLGGRARRSRARSSPPTGCARSSAPASTTSRPAPTPSPSSTLVVGAPGPARAHDRRRHPRPRPGRRAAWRELARSHGVPCVAVAFDTPPALCRRRNAERPPDERVPPKILSGQLAAYAEQRPGLDAEGFDEVLAAEPARSSPPPSRGRPRRGRRAPERRRTPRRAPAVRAAPVDLPRPRPPSSASGCGTSPPAPRRPASTRSGSWTTSGRSRSSAAPWEDMPEAVATLGHLAAATTRPTIGALVHPA